MNWLRSAMSGSLRRRAFLPMLLVAAAFMAATAAVTHTMMEELLSQRMLSRSELTANMVANVVEAQHEPGDVRRMVMALGADRQVREILVVTGSPPRVVAATRNEWTDGELATIADPRMQAQVRSVLSTRRQSGVRIPGSDLVSFVVPIQRDVAGGAPLRGAIAVMVDGAALRAQIGAWLWRIVGLFVLIELLGLLFTEIFLRRYVLGPVRAISESAQRMRAGTPVPADLRRADDEIGRLARALDELHCELAATIDELAFQKRALDQSATVMVTDEDNHVVYVNDAYCALCGYSREELMGQKPSLLNSGQHTPEFFLELSASLQAGRVWKGEICNRARDGHLYWVQATVFPSLDPQGRVVRQTAVLFDVTERRRAEAEARAADARFRETANHAPVFIWRTNDQGRATFLSRPFLEFLGLDAEQATGLHWSAILHPDEIALGERVQREAAATKQPFEVELRVRRHDGEYRTLLARGVPDPCESDDRAFIGSCVDITERVQAESAMRASEARMRQVLETTVDAVITIDETGRITDWTPQAEGMFGWPAAEAVGLTLAETIVPLQYRAAHLRGLARHMRSGGGHLLNQRIELTGLRRSGEEFPIELSISALPLSGHTSFSAFVRDISDRKRAEADLVRARDAAQTASRAKSEFLATMSHEIRTPMNGVIGFTDLLLDTGLDPAQHEYAEMIRSSGQSLLALINDILDFSKIEAGKLDVEHVAFDARRGAGEVVELLTARAEERGLEVILDWPADVPSQTVGDPMRFRQVLLNLAGNAIKFTPSGHVLVVAERHEQGRVRLQVRDTGIGIPEDKLPSLFRKFTQADSSTTRRFGGTGLGLAISKQLVELMDGTIGAESCPGQGSNFWFTLRVAEPAAQPLAIAELAPAPARRVLVVDDVDAARRVLCGYLGQAGVDAVPAASAEEAMVLLRAAAASGRAFGAALVDLQMPILDGEALGRAISADPATGRPVLLLLASASHRNDVEHFRGLGFAGVMFKPVVRAEPVLEALAAAYHEAAQATAAGARTERPAPATEAPGDDEKPFAGTRVLLAEDGAINRRLALRVLGKLGCTVDVAENGVEACALAAASGYDLVLMDCHMPEMDGYEATMAIRARESNESAEGKPGRPVPIVALTASALKEDRDRCFASGMDDFISKPFRPEQIQGALARWTGRDGSERTLRKAA